MSGEFYEEIEKNAKKIWDTLSVIDVKDHTETKVVNGKSFTYLSWAWAWGVLMKHFPGAQYRFLDETHLENCTVREKVGSDWKSFTGRTTMVGVQMDILGVERYMWLPVMNAKNNAQIDPCARSISDARMRCLVKVLALYGLGHYIYAGEDVPDADSDTGANSAKPAKGAKKEDSTGGGTSSAEENEHARVVRETVSCFLTECNDVTSLEDFWKSNKAALARVKRECPSVFDGLVSEFKSVKDKLTK